MARVLIVSLVFPPDNNSTAQIMADLAEDLRNLGHDVAIITTTPHNNPDPEAERTQPLHRVSRFFWRSEYHGIPVLHAKMPPKQASRVKRIGSWLAFSVLGVAAGWASAKRDIIISPSPPLTIGVSAWLIGMWHRAPFIYNVQEVYPDIAVELGALRSRPLIRLLQAMESFVYGKAAAVTVIGERMHRNLSAKGVPQDKLFIVPNFVDVSKMREIPKRNAFSDRHGLADKFIVSYAGNMGPAQGLETVLDAAALCRDREDVVFLLVGNGIMRSALERRIERERLANVLLLPQQPYSAVPEIYGASDLSLVPQAPHTGGNATPSKVYRIMASARPILASTETDSDVAHIVRAAACGAVVPPGDAAAMVRAVRSAADEPLQWRAMGLKGREYVRTRYERTTVTKQYDVLVTLLTHRSPR